MALSLLVVSGCGGDGPGDARDVAEIDLDAADGGTGETTLDAERDSTATGGDDTSVDAAEPDGTDVDARPADVDAADAGGCAPPSEGFWATFEVAGERFRAVLTSSGAVQTAIAIWRGETSHKIPGGDLVCEPRDWNCGYSWHLEPGSIEFADVYIEICDGRPSYIESHCESFGARYCPWSALLVDLRDCRGGSCTPVSR